MKKQIFAGSLIAAGLALSAFAWVRGSAAETFAGEITKAGGVSSQITSTVVGSGKTNYSFDFAAPNKARIETPTTLLVSDGTDVYTYYKGQNAYTKSAFSKDALLKRMNADEFAFFRPAIDPALSQKFGKEQSKGTTEIRGSSMNVYSCVLDASMGKTADLYFSEDNLLRKMEVKSKTDGKIVDYTTMTLGKPSDAKFTFKAPAGSTEITEADLNAGKWYEHLSEALAEAKRTNRMVFLDFYFDGCVWCEKLEADVYSTQEWKDLSKQFVLCKIDIIDQPEENAPFGVTGVPNVKFVKADGTVVSEVAGYKPAGPFLDDMKKALTMK